MEENQNEPIPATPAKTYKIEVTADEAKKGCKKTVRYKKKAADGSDETVRLSVEIPAGTKDKEIVFVSDEGDWNEAAGKKNAAVLVVKIIGTASEDSANGMPQQEENMANEEDFEIKGGILKKYKGAGGNVVIPGGITKVGHNSFENCKALVSVTVPEGVVQISEYAFSGCTALESVVIPNSVRKISNYAFKGCTALKSVEIPQSVRQIGHGAFQNCSALDSINALENVELIGQNAFIGCALKEVTLGESTWYWRERHDTDLDTFEESCDVSGGEILIGTDEEIDEYGNMDDESEEKYVIDGFVIEKGRLLEYNGKGGDIVIPEDVTRIWSGYDEDRDDFYGPFYGCESITSVVIPSSVTKISDNAFDGCSALKSVVIPESVTEIGESAFEGCSLLASVVIPSSVKSIGENAFNGCDALKSASVAAGAFVGKDAFPEGCKVDGIENAITYSFEIDENGVLEGFEGSGDIVIPEGVTEISIGLGDNWDPQGPFCNNTSITSVVLPKTLTEITGQDEGGVFFGCTALKSVVIQEGVTEIGERAFEGCASLSSVTIPSSVTKIYHDAFKNCGFAEDFKAEAAGWRFENSLAIKDGVLKYCTNANAEKIVIPEDVTEIAEKAFEGVRGKVTMTLPKSMTKIPKKAFDEFSSLRAVEIPEGVTEIGESAFSGCESLTSFVIPESVTEIGGYAFNGCTSLTSVVIPEGVTEIGKFAFSGCKSLSSIAIPEGVTQIGRYAFSGCESLASVVIPLSVTEIDDYAFKGCTALKSASVPAATFYEEDSFPEGCEIKEIKDPDSNGHYFLINDGILKKYKGKGGEVSIPEGITEIGDWAFKGCTSLSSVTIPEGVTKIGENAFSGCTSLSSIAISKSVTYIDYYAFKNCGFAEDFKAEAAGWRFENSLAIKDGVVLYCTNANAEKITIPEGVTEIAQRAFEGCTALKSASVPAATFYESNNDYYRSFPEDCEIKEIEDPNSNGHYFLIKDGILKKYKGKGGEVAIPEGVTKIGENAFSGCTSLSSIAIPKSVTYIGDYAFEGCASLTSVAIPEGVTYIDDYAFEGCTSLKQVTVPAMAEIGDDAFPEGCEVNTVGVNYAKPLSVSEENVAAYFECHDEERDCDIQYIYFKDGFFQRNAIQDGKSETQYFGAYSGDISSKAELKIDERSSFNGGESRTVIFEGDTMRIEGGSYVYVRK